MNLKHPAGSWMMKRMEYSEANVDILIHCHWNRLFNFYPGCFVIVFAHAPLEIALIAKKTALFMLFSYEQWSFFNRLFLYSLLNDPRNVYSIEALLFVLFIWFTIKWLWCLCICQILVFLSLWLFHSNDKTTTDSYWIHGPVYCHIFYFFYNPRKNTNFHLS